MGTVDCNDAYLAKFRVECADTLLWRLTVRNASISNANAHFTKNRIQAPRSLHLICPIFGIRPVILQYELFVCILVKSVRL